MVTKNKNIEQRTKQSLQGVQKNWQVLAGFWLILEIHFKMCIKSTFNEGISF